MSGGNHRNDSGHQADTAGCQLVSATTVAASLGVWNNGILSDMKSVNRGRAREKPEGDIWYPGYPGNSIPKAHHWKCWKVGLPEHDGGELTDTHRLRENRLGAAPG